MKKIAIRRWAPPRHETCQKYLPNTWWYRERLSMSDDLLHSTFGLIDKRPPHIYVQKYKSRTTFDLGHDATCFLSFFLFFFFKFFWVSTLIGILLFSTKNFNKQLFFVHKGWSENLKNDRGSSLSESKKKRAMAQVARLYYFTHAYNTHNFFAQCN